MTMGFSLLERGVACSLASALGSFVSSTGAGVFGLDFDGGFIFPQSLERRLPDIAGAGPAGELDFGDQFRPGPMNIRLLTWGADAGERGFV